MSWTRVITCKPIFLISQHFKSQVSFFELRDINLFVCLPAKINWIKGTGHLMKVLKISPK